MDTVLGDGRPDSGGGAGGRRRTQFVRGGGGMVEQQVAGDVHSVSEWRRGRRPETYTVAGGDEAGDRRRIQR